MNPLRKNALEDLLDRMAQDYSYKIGPAITECEEGGYIIDHIKLSLILRRLAQEAYEQGALSRPAISSGSAAASRGGSGPTPPAADPSQPAP